MRDVIKTTTIREFRDNATGLPRSRAPILVTHRGRLAGIFLPRPELSLPIELNRERFDMLSSDVTRQLKRRFAKTTCRRTSTRCEGDAVQPIAAADEHCHESELFRDLEG